MDEYCSAHLKLWQEHADIPVNTEYFCYPYLEKGALRSEVEGSYADFNA